MRKYSPNDLFKHAGEIELNACIGTNGGPYDYGDFSHGYFSAAEALVDLLRDGGRPNFFVDTAVYPIVSNYRHGLELALKNSIRKCCLVNDEGKDFDATHKIESLWKRYVSEVRKIEVELISEEDEQFATRVIADFSETDPIGMVFRYPEDRDKNLQIDTFDCLSLDLLQEVMKRIIDIFERVDLQLDQILEYIAESRHNMA